MMSTLILAAATAVATNLPTVVVEASRLDRTPMDVPSAVRVIGREAISASGARDAVDLVSKVAPEVHLRRLGAGNPALADVSMRGYGENGHGRTLVLVDGERLNSPDMSAPNLARIPLAGVAKVEVLGGPQSVLGGIAEDGVKYWADGAWDRADGYRSQSGYTLWNLNGGIKKDWASGTYLRVSGFFSDSQYDLPGSLSWNEWRVAPQHSNASEDRFRRTTYGFNTTFNAQLNEENAVRLTGNFSNRKMWGYQQGQGWFADNTYDI